MLYTSLAPKFIETDETIMSRHTDQLSFTTGQVMLWNDQLVTGDASSSKAHSKGILQYNPGQKGFLFTHSIPQFVDTSEGTFNPVTRESSVYGQSIICVTLNTAAQVSSITEHVYGKNANVYVNTFKSSLLGLKSLKSQAGLSQTPLVMNSWLPSGFQLVTKTAKSNEQVFEEFLGNYFNSGWLVNTWSRPYKPSTCTGPRITSNITQKNLGGFYWTSNQDHSKWALSYGDQRKIVCIGDLNHMDSQAKRAGSFVCKDDPRLYQAFLSFTTLDDCGIIKPNGLTKVVQ